MIKLIACVNADGNLAGFKPPSDDLKRFAALTIGGVVVMGRKTWESLPPKMRPLPHRENVIVSHNRNYKHHADATCYVGPSALDPVFAQFCRTHVDAWIIGGGEIYLQTIKRAQMVYLSRTPDVGGTVAFPMNALELEFTEINHQRHESHEFGIYERVIFGDPANRAVPR